jgi:hypothetical protein
MKPNTITFTHASRDQFREAYTEAVACDVSSFYFNGHEYDREYAKYLLEFLDQKLGPTTTENYHG